MLSTRKRPCSQMNNNMMNDQEVSLNSPMVT
jgi:hypothetical protein